MSSMTEDIREHGESMMSGANRDEGMQFGGGHIFLQKE